MSAEKLQELMAKATPGEWKLVNDAQGPCMVMHPEKYGVAIASLTDVHLPKNGFHDPTVDVAEKCEENDNGITYRPERVANAKLIVAMHEALPALLADQRRWDWLEANAADLRERNGRWKVATCESPVGDDLNNSGYSTAREAVDAAMERDAQGGKE